MTDDRYEPTFATAADAVRAERGSDVIRSGTRFGVLTATGVMVALIISRVATERTDWQSWALSPGQTLGECLRWALFTVLVIGGAALVGRLVGMFIAYPNFWDAEPLQGDHPDDMEALVERLKTGQPPTVPRAAVRKANRNDIVIGRRTASAQAVRSRLNPYLRWPIMGAVCAAGVYGTLLIAMIGDQSGGARSGNLPTALIIVSVFIAGIVGVGFVVVGAFAGLILRSCWDFVRSALQPAHGSAARFSPTNANTDDPFADRFGHLDDGELAAVRGPREDEGTEFVDPNEIEIVAEPRSAAMAPSAGEANRPAPDLTMHLRWAGLGAMVAAGVTVTALLATVTERNRVMTRAWSSDDVFRLVVSVIVFGGLALAMGGGAGVVLRIVWDALGISNIRRKPPASVPTDANVSDPFADRFGESE